MKPQAIAMPSTTMPMKQLRFSVYLSGTGTFIPKIPEAQQRGRTLV